jgi:maleylacetoacetate isomerase
MSGLKLYSFHSSSTSFRVRIGLALKGLSYEYVPVAMRWEAADHDRPEYKAFNPQGNVPVLADGPTVIQQSLAILEYLDEAYPERPILPREPAGRARVRSIALHLCCEIQPMSNLRVERYLGMTLGFDANARKEWKRHWTGVGLDAIERQLVGSPSTGRYCHGDTPTIADCCLVPQVYNVRRPVVDLDLARWPTITRIWETCMATPAFERALPVHQPDFQEMGDH